MKRLLLLGGGHAQIQVLQSLAERPLAGATVTLVTPQPRQLYSGMLPGWIAGHYPIEACAIPLDALAARAGVALQATSAASLDLSAHRVTCADGSVPGFDLLAIDTGSLPATQALPGSAEHALPLRPIEAFVARWPAMVERIARTRDRHDLCLLGAGAAGVEVAFAIRHLADLRGWRHLRLTLVGADALPLAGAPQGLRQAVAGRLAARGIAWLGGRRAQAVEAGHVRFDDGSAHAFDACLVVTGAAAPAWVGGSGLATDQAGFIRVGPTLRSLSHAEVFAAGDVAAYADPRPKSGVFAVRAGPVLAANLRAACEGRPLTAWQPQRRALYLISTGDRQAYASWGAAWASGRPVWWWKDRIDRRFVRRFSGGR